MDEALDQNIKKGFEVDEQDKYDAIEENQFFLHTLLEYERAVEFNDTVEKTKMRRTIGKVSWMIVKLCRDNQMNRVVTVS